MCVGCWDFFVVVIVLLFWGLWGFFWEACFLAWVVGIWGFFLERIVYFHLVLN